MSDKYANGSEVRAPRAEAERVKRIARPPWRACKVVVRQIRGALATRHQCHLREREMPLRHATEAGWHDLPEDKRPCATR
jgi:hypothetical protein